MRPSFEYVIKYDKPKIIAEIGVASGDNALDMIMNYPIDYMLLVDNYLPYTDIANNNIVSLEQQNDNLFIMLKKFLPRQYMNKIVFSYISSKEVVKYIPDNFFDYIYIDGSHEYNDAKQDMELWFPKVKNNGYISGHDFNGYYESVTIAVNEFISKNSENGTFINVNNDNDDVRYRSHDWLFKKCIKY